MPQKIKGFAHIDEFIELRPQSFEKLFRQERERVRREIEHREREQGWRRNLPRCGALARSTGQPCRAPGNGAGGRCKLHGGQSTGPRTTEGRARIAEAARRRWATWRRQRGAEK
jgi:hypothetical protein